MKSFVTLKSWINLEGLLFLQFRKYFKKKEDNACSKDISKSVTINTAASLTAIKKTVSCAISVSHITFLITKTDCKNVRIFFFSFNLP